MNTPDAGVTASHQVMPIDKQTRPAHETFNMPTNRPARHFTLALLAAGVLFFTLGSPALARQATQELGAPSIHVRYKESDAASFYSEVTVKRVVPGTYFAVTGWHNGYFGMQERIDGKRVLIFSVWGSTNDNPATMAKKDLVNLIDKDPAMRIAQFGNEGSGAQALLDFDWKANTTYAFMVKAKIVDDRAEYAGYVRTPEAKRWRHLVTFSTPHNPTLLRGLHSFVEDFRRDDSSAKEVRRATFSNAWIRKPDGSTLRLLSTTMTTAPSGARAVDAEVATLGITVATGGYTENITTAIGKRVERVQSINDELPGDL